MEQEWRLSGLGICLIIAGSVGIVLGTSSLSSYVSSVLGIILEIPNLASTISLVFGAVSVFLGVVSLVSGWNLHKTIRRQERMLDAHIGETTVLRNVLRDEKSRSAELQEDLKKERSKKEDLRTEKQRENQKLRNLKRVLRSKGIDTQYISDKYDGTLRAPLMVLTHFNAPDYNTEEDAAMIKSNFADLDAKTLHGATKIIPPRNFDQSIKTKEQLERWFDDKVLGGQSGLTHKLEAISVADLTRVFDRDQTEGVRGWEMNTVSSLFDTDTVIPTEDLLELLARSDRISIESELRDNVALLAINYASENQIEQIIRRQSDIQSELGEITQIANTAPAQIERVLLENGVSGADELAGHIRDEASRLSEILGEDISTSQFPAPSEGSATGQ